MRVFRRFLSDLSLARPQVDDAPQEPPWISPWDVGFRDAVFSGWFRPNGELFEGFPVAAEDVVLDAGCGDGGYTHYCARQGAHVIFADIDPAMVAAAARRLSNSGARALTPIVTDCMPLPLDDATATRVVATEMLEHVADPKEVLRELVRVGRPGALYLLAVPDPVGEELQMGLFPTRFATETGHLRVFQRSEFAALVTASGLAIREQRYVGFFWSLWSTLYWNSGVDIAEPRHPTLDNWVRTWDKLLDTPDGARVKMALDALMPKSQLILARKP
jgi:SAM-dependent methyltransferase